FGERLGDLEVRVVRRGDRHEVDALVLGQLRLFFDHLLVGGVSAFGLDVVIGRGGLGFGGIAGEGAGDEGGTVVEDGRRGVNPADKGALAAADQAHAQLAIERGIRWHWRGSPDVGKNEAFGPRARRYYQNAARGEER